MSEAIFPLLGAAFVVVAVLPASALLARLALGLLARRAVGTLHGLDARFLVLLASTMVPMAWLISAGLHQAETGRSMVTCLLHPCEPGSCLEPGLFALTLGLALVGFCLKPLVGRGRGARATALASSELGPRIEALLAAPALAWLRGRVAVTEEPGFALAARGLWRPSIVVGAAYASSLDDRSLAAALAHEAEHLRSRDPLRYRLLQLALAANPFGAWLLGAEAARWLRAREAHCDREAVLGGADPLCLAGAIVRAARPEAQTAALGAPDAAVLRFRVELLCAYAESPPRRCCPRPVPVFVTTLALLLLTLLLPHQAGTAALDALHAGAERAASLLWR